MTATTATDVSGVEYYFECTAGGGNDSEWQDSATYEDTGLTLNTTYTYKVKARDKSVNQNETAFSSEASDTTDEYPAIYVNDITMSLRFQAGSGGAWYGQATVWIKDANGDNVVGATVTGDWDGNCIDEAGDNGVTGADGKVLIESGNKKKFCTWEFTVTDVVKSGYIYKSVLNTPGETTDSIYAGW